MKLLDKVNPYLDIDDCVFINNRDRNTLIPYLKINNNSNSGVVQVISIQKQRRKYGKNVRYLITFLTSIEKSYYVTEKDLPLDKISNFYRIIDKNKYNVINALRFFVKDNLNNHVEAVLKCDSNKHNKRYFSLSLDNNNIVLTYADAMLLLETFVPSDTIKVETEQI